MVSFVASLNISSARISLPAPLKVDQLRMLRQASAFRKKLSPHPSRDAIRIRQHSDTRTYLFSKNYYSCNNSCRLGIEALQSITSTRPMATITLSPRLVRLTTLGHLSRPAVLSTRVFTSRYSTSAEDEIIKVQQIPAPGSGHVRVLLLNRPKARNAISRQLLETLSKQVNSIAAENGDGPTRALVVASNVDAAFCAGADLKERAKMTHAE